VKCVTDFCCASS